MFSFLSIVFLCKPKQTYQRHPKGVLMVLNGFLHTKQYPLGGPSIFLFQGGFSFVWVFCFRAFLWFLKPVEFPLCGSFARFSTD